jgi:hypothetical protein
MHREVAKELKRAGFPIAAYRAGHTFYPPEEGGGWSDGARRYGITLSHYDLDERMQEIKDGYYCPDLSELIAACGPRFAALSVEANIWTAVSKDPERVVIRHAADDAVAGLWLALQDFGATGSSAAT